MQIPSMDVDNTQAKFPCTRCRFGIAARDVTPPVGIYHRSWGAAAHELAEGVHRPLTATAAVFTLLEGNAPTLALVALDHGWFTNLQDERDLRSAVLERTGLDPAELMITLSHTHATANLNSFLTDRPGGEFIKPHLARLVAEISSAILEARQSQTCAWITYGQGICALAVNRDYWDAAAQHWACGFNPDGAPDDTLLVARVTAADGRVIATLFNYACHPTTLAWQNRLLSPDFVGAAREILERAFAAPSLFLQGASGELSPREQYVGETEAADRNGRILGYAAAAALEALPPPAAKFVYAGIVRSGADLGTWTYQPYQPDELQGIDRLQARMSHVDLMRKHLPSSQDLAPLYEAAANAREKEILLRSMLIQKALGSEPVHRMPFWVWRLGNAGFVGIPNECYSILQQTLRQRFASTPLVVMGVTNGWLGYLPPRETYGQGRYQEQQSPYAPRCLEQTIEAVAEALHELFPGETK